MGDRTATNPKSILRQLERGRSAVGRARPMKGRHVARERGRKLAWKTENLGVGDAQLESRCQELTRATLDQPVDDEVMYYDVVVTVPKACLRSQVAKEKEENICRSWC
ncbi:hypothetical protein Scep_030267 [Stephania cephalantha]|uniref:Uncharacterized protein n=1 Tax=Stephania cephalantha TaxID=152367 RepID=A0AAP0DZG2_9MAGN